MIEISRKIQRRSQINELVEWHGVLTVERVLEVHRTTIQRWCNGKVDAPIVAIIALRALRGEFPMMEAEQPWRGWTFSRDGKLYCPANRAYTEGEVRAIFYQNQIVKEQHRKIIELEAKLKEAGLSTKITITANETYENPNHPAMQLLEENYQLKRKAKSNGR